MRRAVCHPSVRRIGNWIEALRCVAACFCCRGGAESLSAAEARGDARGPTGSGEGPGVLDTLHFPAAGERRVRFRMSGVSLKKQHRR